MTEDYFPKRLAQLRMEKGVSARDMSLSIGQNAGYINNIENKKNLPSMNVFFYICEYLNITPRDFFDGDASDPVKLNNVICDLKLLNEDQIYTIGELVKGLKR